MERPVAGPRRPARVLESSSGLQAMLFSRGWFVIGAVGLVTVVGLGTVLPSEGIEVLDWGGRRSGAELSDPRDLFSRYGVAFLLAWPAVLVIGCLRGVVLQETSARHEAWMESQRSRVHLTLLATAYLAVVAGWAGALVLVVRWWPEPAHAVGTFVSAALIMYLVSAVVRAALRRIARRPGGDDASPSEGLA